MKLSKFHWFWAVFAFLTLAGAIFFFITGGIKAAAAYLIGILCTGLHLVTLRWLLSLWTKAFASPDSRIRPTLGTIVLVGAALISLPVLVYAGMYIQTISPANISCFLWGLCLVYFALVGWATLSR